MPRIGETVNRWHGREAVAHHEAGHIVAWWHFDVDVDGAAIDLGPPLYGCVIPAHGSTSTPMVQTIVELAAWVSEAICVNGNPLASRQSLLVDLIEPELSDQDIVDAHDHAIVVIEGSAQAVALVAASLLSNGALGKTDLRRIRATCQRWIVPRPNE